MKILISPAKLMSLETDNRWEKQSKPRFLKEAEEVMQILKQADERELKDLMKISSNIADINVERNQLWNTKPKSDEALQASLAFKGEVYKGLDAESLDEAAIDYLEKNLFILSGLYGLLRPTDQIMLHRLEMGTKLDVNGSNNLYGFWKDKLTTYVNKSLDKGEFILNLASAEYVKVLDQKKLKAEFIDVDFLDYREGKLKKIIVYFKHARGLMTRYCAENKISSLEDLKHFNVENYHFDQNLSTPTKLVFTR